MSEYNQSSFQGGMNLLLDDTRLQPNQYVVGFNLRNRDDELSCVLESVLDVALPNGLKQGVLTFGNYVIAFVAGKAYYRYYLESGWTPIEGFSMSPDAPRYWTVSVPVTTTNYARIGVLQKNAAGGNSSVVNPYSPIISSNSIAASAAGNLPGLLVQDNVNQAQFIYIQNSTTNPVISKVTQTYAEWSITIDMTTLLVTEDKREYVPIGNNMAWVDGILYVASQDTNFIYRSVSGRPLDFVLNVDEDGDKGGDATTTSYSVGVGGISCLREMADGSLFVAASNANFKVQTNKTPDAQRIFGEYTFIRTFLFNATCLSDRAIMDSLGDTRFIDLTGVRSFNAILQDKNEGKNSVFTSTIQSALTKLPNDTVDLVQNPLLSACILYDNYEMYAVKTIFGPAIGVYDTLSQCWSSFDISQTGGQRIKQFAKIESTIQRLYAITEDNKLYTLYSGTRNTTATVRTISVSKNTLEQGKENIPRVEVKLNNFRVVVNRITSNIVISATPFVNNRLTKQTTQDKPITFVASSTPYVGSLVMPDIDTQLANELFTFPETGQGWKTFILLSWNGGSVTQYSMELTDVTPQNPLLSQTL